MDRYQSAVEIILDIPAPDRRPQSRRLWLSVCGPTLRRASCLFAFLGPKPQNDSFCCPTLWKSRQTGLWSPPPEPLVRESVDSNPLIPTNVDDLPWEDSCELRKSLNAFAHAQRLADRLQNRDWSRWDSLFPPGGDNLTAEDPDPASQGD